MGPRAPYSRLPSDNLIGGGESVPLAPPGDPLPQPKHRAPHSHFYSAVLNRHNIKPFLRWLGTLALTLSIFWTLRVYERKGNFSLYQKTIFSGITTALILGLGLNFFVSRSSALTAGQWLTLPQEGFKELAKIIRWRLWAVKGCTLREKELILGLDSLLVVRKLAFESARRRRKRILLFCISWVSCR